MFPSVPQAARQAPLPVLDSFRVGFCVQCQIKVQFHSLACGIAAFLTLFAEETVFPNYCSFVTCLEVRRRCVWLCSPFSRSRGLFVESVAPPEFEDGSPYFCEEGRPGPGGDRVALSTAAGGVDILRCCVVRPQSRDAFHLLVFSLIPLISVLSLSVELFHTLS